MQLIVRQRSPQNRESPRSIFNECRTANHLFYVRNHFDTPRISTEAWRLNVEGEVSSALELTFPELMAMPSRTVVCTMECAGNGRTLLDEPVKGVQWELGAVGTAEWTGVPLGLVLERAGLTADAVEVILEGADCGTLDEEPKSPGEITYSRSLSIAKALNGDVLLAHRMNGEDLSPPHGFPVRAIVPGWYGMASVKWLRRIIVTSCRFEGYFQTLEYSHWREIAGIQTLVALDAGQVKAQMVYPMNNQTLEADSLCRIHGAAWAGESSVASVDISVDGGANWTPARLADPPKPYCWTRWEYEWQTPDRDVETTLLARARDLEGRVQPLSRDKNERTYSIHHVLPVEVRIAR